MTSFYRPTVNVRQKNLEVYVIAPKILFERDYSINAKNKQN